MPQHTYPTYSTSQITQVYIPKGRYPIGSETLRVDSSPCHMVEIDAFYIDVFFVTVGQVLEIISQYPELTPRAWPGAVSQDNYALPATMISYEEAQQLAKAMGKRLPTEVEWETAAGKAWGRANAGYKYPKTHFDRNMTHKEAVMQGMVSPEGIVGMSGIFWHWTSSRYDWYKSSENIDKIDFSSMSDYRVLRGYGWTEYDFSIAYRSFKNKLHGYSNIAFRCVQDAGVT